MTLEPPPSVAAAPEIDRRHVLQLIDEQRNLLAERTPQAYERLEQTNEGLLRGCEDIIDRYGLPCYTEGLGAKGCVVFSQEPLREYRDYLTKVDDDLSTLAWLQHMNHGIFMTPGVEEEWTISLAHTDEHVKRYLDAFDAFARSLNG